MHSDKTLLSTYLTEDSSRHVLIEESDDDPRVLTLQDKRNERHNKQEYIPVGCVPPARYLDRDPLDRDPLDIDPPYGQTDTSENITFANFAGGNKDDHVYRNDKTELWLQLIQYCLQPYLQAFPTWFNHEKSHQWLKLY